MVPKGHILELSTLHTRIRPSWGSKIMDNGRTVAGIVKEFVTALTPILTADGPKDPLYINRK
jgi:hypothetical protein